MLVIFKYFVVGEAVENYGWESYPRKRWLPEPHVVQRPGSWGQWMNSLNPKLICQWSKSIKKLQQWSNELINNINELVNQFSYQPIDKFHDRLNFDMGNVNKMFEQRWKENLKMSIKLPGLVAKCCKIQKIFWSLWILFIFVLHTESLSHSFQMR